MTFALAMTAFLLPTPGRAQGVQPCSGQANVVNGQVAVENFTPSVGLDSQCEVLAMPGGLIVQNGGDRAAIDGIDGTHEGAGGGHTGAGHT